MIKRRYGNTGKEIFPVGFGCMRFSREDYMHNKEKCADLIRYAHSKNINFFDTAPKYCESQSEFCLGIAFEKMKRNEFVVSSKVMTEPDRNAINTYDTIQKSLEKMKIDKLDICHAWCLRTFEDFERITKSGGVYEGMMKAQQDGLIDVVSFSTHMCGSDIARVAKEHPDAFQGILLGYNALNYTYREDGIKAFAELGKGIVIMNPLGGGLIPQNPNLFKNLAINGDSLNVSALKFLLSQSRITAVLSGMTSEKDIDENVLAVENLYDESKIMTDIENKTVSSDGFNDVCTLCSYCDACPVGINPHKLMFAYNQQVLRHQSDLVLTQIDLHFGLDARETRKCIGCGKCEKLCTQKLPIIERIKDIQNMIADWN